MSTVNLKKFFYYPAPPPHIINYSWSVVKHFLALIVDNFPGITDKRASASERAGGEPASASERASANPRAQRVLQKCNTSPPIIPCIIS